MDADLLNSWKEIASYVGRGVRTVQRWERDLGFPVRRPREKKRSVVIASKLEIDLWMRTPHSQQAQAQQHYIKPKTYEGLTKAELLRKISAMLIASSQTLRKRISQELALSSAQATSYAGG